MTDTNMGTLLLTGFEPFGKWSTNPSWEIARALDGLQVGGLRVVSRQLPVDWDRSWPALQKAIEETEPRWALMLGQAGKRTHISVESLARNICNGKPDNARSAPAIESIEEGGADQLPATLPVDAMVSRIAELGLPVERSEDAGGYLCNHTLYRALAWAASGSHQHEHAPSVGFIHVPALPDPANGITGMALDDMIRAVRAAIAALARDQRPKTKDQRPKTKDQRPKTKDQRPKTKDQGPRTTGSKI